MAMLVIKCPNTGKMIPTGIGMDKRSFETATLSNNSVRCAACGQMHVWNKNDARLQEESTAH